MKFNLRSRPGQPIIVKERMLQKTSRTEMQRTLRLYSLATEEWFEGFEKELRKKLMDLPYDKNIHERGVEQTIKEILGDSE